MTKKNREGKATSSLSGSTLGICWFSLFLNSSTEIKRIKLASSQRNTPEIILIQYLWMKINLKMCRIQFLKSLYIGHQILADKKVICMSQMTLIWSNLFCVILNSSYVMNYKIPHLYGNVKYVKATTTEGHQWVFNVARNSSTRRRPSAGP